MLFGLVKQLIGTDKHGLNVVFRPTPSGDTYATGDANTCSGIVQRRVAQDLQQALGHRMCARQVGIWEQDEELFPADAGDQVMLTHNLVK
ncbi:hypothetical protein D3C81_1700270 [compost metagenome]